VTHWSIRVVLFTLLFLLCPSVPAAGQSQDALRLDRFDSLIAEGDELHRLFKPEEALDLYRVLLAERGDEARVLWRACREAVLIGMEQDEWEEEKRWYRIGEEYGRRAVTLDLVSADARYWLLAAIGRRSLHVPVGETIQAARDSYEGVNELLALNPDYPGGHLILGKFHMEVMHLSAFKRFLARLFGAGEGLKTASWESAEAHLKRAIELDPGAILHHLELGRMYMWTDRPAEARTQLLNALDLPENDLMDRASRREAQELLQELKEGGGNASVPPLIGMIQ
jgi:tetratricopeptide (TPR) repeat protein